MTAETSEYLHDIPDDSQLLNNISVVDYGLARIKFPGGAQISLKMAVLWDVAPCSLVEVYRHLRTHRLENLKSYGFFFIRYHSQTGSRNQTSSYAIGTVPGTVSTAKGVLACS
jgi:hypothetical protein